MKNPKELFLDYTDSKGVNRYRTPRQVLESIDTAGQEINYSNYDNHNLGIAKNIVRIFCKEHGLSLGPSKKQLEYRIKRKQDAALRNFQKIEDEKDPTKKLKMTLAHIKKFIG
jgi:hypothetical protein